MQISIRSSRFEQIFWTIPDVSTVAFLLVLITPTALDLLLTVMLLGIRS